MADSIPQVKSYIPRSTHAALDRLDNAITKFEKVASECAAGIDGVTENGGLRELLKDHDWFSGGK